MRSRLLTGRPAATVCRSVPAMLVAAVLTAVAVAAGPVPGPRRAVAAPRVPTQAVAAARFLAAQFRAHDDSLPPAFGTNPDTGLVADALIGMAATGTDPDEVARGTAKLRAAYFNATITFSGNVAKDIMVADVAGVDPRHWGTDAAGVPIDLVGRLQATLDDHGRYTNAGMDARHDLSNTFSQSLSIIALHRYRALPSATHPPGTADERSAVAYLLRQQCPSGGFRLAPPVGREGTRCDAPDGMNVSVDNTSMAVWALTEVGGHAGAVRRAVDWLRDKQDDSGAFGMDSTDAGTVADTVNANSTGLAAMALTRAGDTGTAATATRWLTSMQLDADEVPDELAGAVAYNPADLRALTADAAGFWGSQGNQDRVRRATAQAVLGLAATPPAATSPTTGTRTPPNTAPARPGGAGGRHASGGSPAAGTGTGAVGPGVRPPGTATPRPGGAAGGARLAPGTSSGTVAGASGPATSPAPSAGPAVRADGSALRDLAAFAGSMPGIVAAIAVGLLLAAGSCALIVRLTRRGTGGHRA